MLNTSNSGSHANDGWIGVGGFGGGGGTACVLDLG